MVIRRDVAVLGASLGGIDALSRILSGVPESHSGSLLIVLHMSANTPSLAVEILSKFSRLPVSYAYDDQFIETGHIYVAPRDRHLIIGETGHLGLKKAPKVHHSRPAADPLFTSAARFYGERLIGVVLSGGDGDGAAGLQAIKRSGGLTIVQHPADAIVPHMPTNAIDNGGADLSISAEEIGCLLARSAL
jgi:two-component system chemotaxis response regulator CheB